MAGLNSINDDSGWPEVEKINSCAVFMGYMKMAERVLGVLVFTWATVVLLGGFVSNLGNVDFRCLAVITLVQTVRTFDFVLMESTSDTLNSMRARMLAVGKAYKKKKCYVVLWYLVGGLGICAVSPAVLCFLGLLLSMGLSSWRLYSHERGYGIAAKDKMVLAHLPSALTVLYVLGEAQGVFYCYRFGWRLGATTGLAEEVAGIYRLDARIVSEYLDETVKECKKDPSFARGRNLVTYAVNLLLMEPTSTSTTTTSRSCSSKYLSGLAILCSILLLQDDADDETDTTTRPWLHEQATMMRQLLAASASFGQAIHRLLETLGPESPYSGAVRQRAARVLEEVAGSVRLEEFPGATRCVASSLLGTFEEHCWRPDGYERDRDLPELYERDWLLKEPERRYILEVVRRSRTRTPSPSLRRRLLKPLQFHHAASNGDGYVAPPPPPPLGSDVVVRGYVGLVVSGLRVLQALAASEDNCRFISGSTRGGGGEVSRIMRPLASGGLHRDHHDEWCMIAEESLKLLTLLMAAPGETGKALRVQIAGDTAGAVAALELFLGAPDARWC